MASKKKNAEEKKFKTLPGKSKVYVYRNEVLGSAIKIKLSLDGTSMGENAPHTYHAWNVEPGKHEISCQGERQDTLIIYAKPNEPVFVWQEMKLGFIIAGCSLHLVSESRGQEEVEDCALAESGPLN